MRPAGAVSPRTWRASAPLPPIRGRAGTDGIGLCDDGRMRTEVGQSFVTVALPGGQEVKVEATGPTDDDGLTSVGLRKPFDFESVLSFRARIDAARLPGDDRRWLLAHLDGLRARWASLSSDRAPVVVHGDAWQGNVAITGDGNGRPA